MTSFTHNNRRTMDKRSAKTVGSSRGNRVPGRKAGRSITAGLVAAAFTALSAGCQDSPTNDGLAAKFPQTTKFIKYMEHPNQKVKPEPPDPPVVVDGAMLARQWPQSDAQWSNAIMVGWPMRFPYNADITVDRPFPNSRLMDTFLFVYQYFRLPFTYIGERPFKTVLWTSDVKYNPTYTAMPAVPPSPEHHIEETAGQVAAPKIIPGYETTGEPLAPGDRTGPAATAPSSTPQAPPATVPVIVPETAPVTVPAAVPETVPATVPAAVPETVPVTVPAAVPGTAPVTVPVTVPSTGSSDNK